MPRLDDTSPRFPIGHCGEAVVTLVLHHDPLGRRVSQVPVGDAARRFVHVEVPVEGHARQSPSSLHGGVVHENQFGATDEKEGVSTQGAPLLQRLGAKALLSPGRPSQEIVEALTHLVQGAIQQDAELARNAQAIAVLHEGLFQDVVRVGQVHGRIAQATQSLHDAGFRRDAPSGAHARSQLRNQPLAVPL